MSKIGKKPIKLPTGVELDFREGSVSVKGPKGLIIKSLPTPIVISIESDKVMIKLEKGVQSRKDKADWGLARSLVQNMILGVTEGFEKVLEFQGVGYKAGVSENGLDLGLGFSHPVKYKAPEGISFKTEKNTITISGIDKELVGKVAAQIRSLREPEPYKGSGIRYQDEVIQRKAGKKAVAAG